MIKAIFFVLPAMAILSLCHSTIGFVPRGLPAAPNWCAIVLRFLFLHFRNRGDTHYVYGQVGVKF